MVTIIHDTQKRSATMPKRGEERLGERHLHLAARLQSLEQAIRLCLVRPPVW